MNAPYHQHRVWLFMVACACVLFAIAPSLSAHFETKMDDAVAVLKNQKESLFNQIRQLESDAIAADELSQTIDTKEIIRFLAPANRRAAAAQLEALAAQSRLDALSYKIAPAMPWAGGSESDTLTQSAITLEANAPSDSDVMTFLSSLTEIGGRIDVQNLSLRRLHKDGKIASLNIHFRATLLWLANREKDQP